MTHSGRISVLPGKSRQRSLYFLLDMEEEACSPRNCWWPAWAHLGNQSKGSTENGKKRCPWWHHWVPGFILTWTYIWTLLLTVPADFLHSLSQFNFLLFFFFQSLATQRFIIMTMTLNVKAPSSPFLSWNISQHSWNYCLLKKKQQEASQFF